MSDLLVEYLERKLSDDNDDVELEIYYIYHELTSDLLGVHHPIATPVEGAYWCLVSSVVYYWCINNRIPLTWELSDLHNAVANWNDKTNRFGHTSLDTKQVMEFGVKWACKIDQLRKTANCGPSV